MGFFFIIVSYFKIPNLITTEDLIIAMTKVGSWNPTQPNLGFLSLIAELEYMLNSLEHKQQAQLIQVASTQAPVTQV